MLKNRDKELTQGLVCVYVYVCMHVCTFVCVLCVHTRVLECKYNVRV
jgi:hypothetical protein